MEKTEKTKKKSKRPGKGGISTKTTYVNVHRSERGYRDKYRKGVEMAVKKFKAELGKPEEYELTQNEWKRFFKTVLIPLDKDSEKRMIDLFLPNREELNHLLILHNTGASDNIAEVYWKKYQKESPTKWYDLEDFKQLALEGLAIAAERFNPDTGNKFITYATWWMLNKVMTPTSAKGARNLFTSLNGEVSPDDGNPTSLEEILSPASINPAWNSPSTDDNMINPAAMIDRRIAEENYDFADAVKKSKTSSDCLDMDKVNRLSDYLLSIVDRRKDNEGRQILLYVFKKIFSRCSALIGESNPDKITRLASCIQEAARSKTELLDRIHMDEKQYERACRKIVNEGDYDGI